jgi:hypothetical protein
MGSAIVLVAMLCVFFVRDVQLLVTAQRTHRMKGLFVYDAFQVAYLALLAAMLPSGAAHRPFRLFQTLPYWIFGVLLHCLIWLVCMRLHQRGKMHDSWMAALRPAPVLLLSLATVTLLFPGSIGSVGVVPLAAIVATIWWAAISLALSFVRSEPSAVEAGFAVEYAGMTNATALILIPLADIVSGF